MNTAPTKFKIPLLAVTSAAILVVFYLNFGFTLSGNGSIFSNADTVFQGRMEAASFESAIGKLLFYFLLFSFASAAFASTKKARWLLLPFVLYLPGLLAYGPFAIYFLLFYSIEPTFYFIGSILVCFILGFLYDRFRVTTAMLCFLIIGATAVPVIRDAQRVRNLPFSSYDSRAQFDLGPLLQEKRKEIMTRVMSSDEFMSSTVLATEFENAIRNEIKVCDGLTDRLSIEACNKVLDSRIMAAVADIRLFVEGYNGMIWRRNTEVEDLKVGSGPVVDIFKPFTLCMTGVRKGDVFNPRGYSSLLDVFKASSAYDDLWFAMFAKGMRDGGVRRFFHPNFEQGYIISVDTKSAVAEADPYNQICYHPE